MCGSQFQAIDAGAAGALFSICSSPKGARFFRGTNGTVLSTWWEITAGAVRYPGLKIHEPRVVRLFEVLLHGGPQIGGWTACQIHQAVLASFDLPAKAYGLNQLRYDLRKLKGHGLIERDGSRYAYRLTQKGIQVALLFLFFHKRLCGPLANSRFHHRPDPVSKPLITVPTPPSNASSTCSLPLELAIGSPKMLDSFCQ